MENQTHKIAASPRKIPLCFVIVVPFVLQIVGAVGLVGYLSFKNGQQAVEDLANQVMRKVGDRIEERLNSYLATPHLINSVNENSINIGKLNLKDFNELEFTFLQQQKLFAVVKSICFTNDEGEIIWTQRQEDGSFVLGILKKSDKANLHTYKLDPQTNKFKLEKVFPNYDPLQRPWYKTAQAAGKQTWSSIYTWVVEANVGIAAVTPIYEAPGKLKGVLSVDFLLSDISKFLSSFKISPSGQTFIMERSGEIVATSTGENPFNINSKGKTIARLKGVDSRDPLTRSTTEYLQKYFNKLTNIETTQTIKFTQKGKLQFAQVTPFRDKFGLDWLIVVVVPEHDFMAKIYANTRTTFLLCLGALGVSILLGIVTARSITLPLLRLSKASQAIANGELDQNVEITGIDELAMMAQSFNQMSQQLQQSQQQLENYSRSLEFQVSQRTQELQQEISDRQLLAEKLRTSEAEVRAFFEAMTDIVLMINAENNDIKVAPTNPSRLYPPDIDILNQTIEQFFLDENAEVFKSNIKRALDTQQIVNFEYSLPVGESKIWFAASISPTTENSVAWVARDISDAVAAALQRKQREEALQLIVEGTASKTGSEFFHYCVRYLAEVLQVRYALVTEFVDTAPTKLRRLAFWTGESWNYEREYDLKDTPCENVIAQKKICYYPDGVQEYFPENRDLINWGIVSYLGIPLVDSGGKVLGHLAVLDVKPMNNELGNQLILRIFAARAGAELERKQAEEKLRASQQRLSFLVQQTPLGVIEWNNNWQITDWNQAAEGIFGYSKAGVLGNNGLKLLVPRNRRSQVRELIDALKNNRGGTYSINENLTKAGKIIVCEWYNTRLIDDSSNIIGYASMVVDITERQQAEVALRENEQFLRSIYEGAEAAIFIIDVLEEGGFRFVATNPAHERMSGMTSAEFCGKTLERALPPEVALAASERYRACVETGERITYEECMQLKGKEIWWLTTMTPLRDNSEERIYRLIGTGINITARKQAEETLQRRAITDSMLSSISRAFLDQDIDTAINFTLQVIGEFTDSDRSYIFRYTDNQTKLYNTHEWCAPGIQPSIDQLQGLPVADYYWLHSQLLSANILQIPCVADLPPEASLGKAELERSSIQSLLAVPIMYGGVVVGSMGLDAVRSSQIWTEEDINLLKLVSEIVAIGLARHEAEVAQQHATEVAIAANRAKSEFLANMSHELRTPLTAILGLSEVLQDEVFGPLTAKQHQKLATIEQSGKHLLELINDVLDLAKIESGKMELQLAPTDIQGLCDASLAFVRQQAHQKQIKLTSQVPPRIGKVVVDERRIRQVLINLLSNAVKFTPEGGAVWIEVKADSENEVLQFSIVDTGIGIAIENIGKLFQPFVQLESSFSRRYTGTGLGLALVRQVIELHRGSVRLESEVGKGSRFTVSLPWIQENIQSVSKSPIANSQVLFPSSPLLNLHKVLIVEDSAPAAEQVARYLAELGVTNSVIHALGTGTVEEALRLKPDAIILDLQLPDRSGWDVLAQLKANPETQNIPVLIMSVVDEPAPPQELEVCEYLVKPFSRSQFQIAWRKVLLAQQRSASSVSPVPPSPLVLLTEDNEANISTIMEYLEVRGYRVAIALNGREAVQLTKELNPDLILMDVQMPEMDGLEATREIRADMTKTHIPIIALTSLAMPGDREKCLEAGMNEYLTKPVSLKKLVEAIASHLGQVNS